MSGVEEPETVTIAIMSKNARTEITHTRRIIGGTRTLEPMSAVLKRVNDDARAWLRRNA